MYRSIYCIFHFQAKTIQQAMSQQALKIIVGQAAADHIAPQLSPKSVVGVGTGSTANCFIDSLAKIKNLFDGTVASSEASAARLRDHGIPVYELNDVNDMDFYVDGADETNNNRQLIKGGGGALTREKIVAAAARSFVCIVDESKIVPTLGTYPLPIEVIPMARSAVARKLVALGGTPVYREGFVTDNGNVILDVHGMHITDPVGLEEQINHLTGVVCNGLFARKPADIVMVATDDGVRTF